MRSISTRLTQTTIAAGALALAMTTANPTIQTVATHGNEVVIAVSNPTARMQTGTVAARVLLSSGEVSATAPVSVAAGQTATVKMVLPGPVLGVVPVGVVVDDGVPF